MANTMAKQRKQNRTDSKIRILSYLRPYLFFAVLAPLFMVGEVLCDLLQPTLMSRIVDQGVLAGNQGMILRTGLIMIAAALLGGVAGISSAGFGSAASQRFGNDLRKAVYDKIMHLPVEQTDRFTTGSLITRLTNDVSMVQTLTETALRMFVRAPLTFLGGIVMAVSLNVNFALVLLISLPLQLLIIWIVLAKAGPLFRIVQEKLDRVNSVVQENVSGARVVKAYVREDYEEERFRKANTELTDTNLKVMKMLAVLNPALMIIMNLSVLAIIYIGGLQVKAGAMQVGKVMAAVTYVTQVLNSIMMVSMMFQSISRGRASAARIREVLSADSASSGDLECKIEENQGTIQFQDVHFVYPHGSGLPVLSGIQLDIRRGETVAILGATGSGKTTLVQLLLRFYDCTQGRILLDGRDIRTFTTESLRSRISMVLQKSELFSGTIRDNIRWGREDATEDEIRAAARIAQADEFIEKFAQQYDTQVGEKGLSLSGGQKQRLCIARALVKKPDILIFDDSTSALDLGTEARLRRALAESCAGMTVIMIAQRVASVQNADKIAVLDGGQIVAVGTHDILLQTCPLYQDIYDSQNKQKEVS